jgi:predicted RNase H-like nuclease (RuvC/YqgF family)
MFVCLTLTDFHLDSPAINTSLQKQLEDYQNNESILAQNLEQLNQKLFDVYKQCEEFREHNAQLISSKQLADKQLEEREKQIKELELSGKNSEEHIHPSKEVCSSNSNSYYFSSV